MTDEEKRVWLNEQRRQRRIALERTYPGRMDIWEVVTVTFLVALIVGWTGFLVAAIVWLAG